MILLPDLVGRSPAVVFCGVAGCGRRHREHYYETPGNSFWESLHLSGFTDRQLVPSDDTSLPGLGLGLTDLVHDYDEDADVHSYAVGELCDKLESWGAEWVAFTSKTVAHVAARVDGVRRPGLGLTDWHLGGAQVFVLPGVSGANRRHDYDGRPTRIAWWRDLAALAGYA